MKLLVVLGSARKSGNGVRVGKFIKAGVEADKRYELDFADLKDIDLPFFNEEFSPKYREYMGKEYTNATGKAWADRVGQADAIILITPEYNHSYSAILKNALDWVGPEWAGKAVGLVGYSGVAFGGVRAIEHLRQIAPELGLIQVTAPLHIVNAPDTLDESGKPAEEATSQHLQTLLDGIYELGQKLSKD